MAATVYNGRGNVTHSNSSGGNQRIVIYWIYKENTNTVDIKWGDLSGNDFNIATMNTNVDQYVGKTLAYGMASSGSNQTIIAEKSYNNSSSIDSSPVPLEVFIADGEGFSITTTNVSPVTIIRGYNFIVIPETN